MADQTATVALDRSGSPTPASRAGALDWSLSMCCPACRGSLRQARLVVDEYGRWKDGQLICDRCECVVATVEQFKYDFHAVGVGPVLGTADPAVVRSTHERRIGAGSPSLSFTSRWHAQPPFMVARGRLGDSLSYRGKFTDALVRLLHHPRGGVVDIYVDNELTASVDLFTAEGSFTVPTVAAGNLEVRSHDLLLAARGTANPESAGTEAVVQDLVLYGPPELDGFREPQPINLGNPYSDFIEGFIDQTATSDLVLEVGGGDRRRCQPNHVNFEYLKFELADVYGDIHAIPFQDGTFALVHSQAVFEHVNDPFAAARELLRVTKPGGLVVTEVAFLQPLHAVPFHYFNMTNWGVRELFAECEVVASDWFGPLSETVSWLIRSANLDQKVDPERIRQIQSEFEAFDQLMTHDDLKAVASGVHIAVRKPG